jgi:hypothetical protein
MRTALTAAALALAALGTLAGPTPIAFADQSAVQTISDLRSQGYTVEIDRIGSGPLGKCVVTSVRNPQTVTQLFPVPGVYVGRNRAPYLAPTVVSKTIQVSLDCTQ